MRTETTNGRHTSNGTAQHADEERLPPHNRDAERSLLGCMLRDNAIVPEVIELVTPPEFYVFGHQVTAKGIIELCGRGDGGSADIVTVSVWLTAHKLMDDAGGHRYIAELIDSAPSMANFRQYAAIIREHAQRRRLHVLLEDLRQRTEDLAENSADIIQGAEQRLREIGRWEKARIEKFTIGELIR